MESKSMGRYFADQHDRSNKRSETFGLDVVGLPVVVLAFAAIAVTIVTQISIYFERLPHVGL